MIRDHFTLDPEVTFLNHGSFGACPREVQEAQSRLRADLERGPVRFLAREIDGRIDAARAVVAAFVGARAENLVFVPNATTGVNAVVRSLRLAAGDEILTTDHAYNACRNVLDWVAGRSGARVVVARVPFPIEHEEQVVEAVLAGASERTRLALLDHVTSPTGLVWPIRKLVAALEGAGIDVLIDGAHAPGMLPLDVAGIDAAYYTGNCHKWMCAPKGAGFLVARGDRQEGLVPAVISHGLNAINPRSRYQALFDWVGTTDPTAWLCVPEAIAAVGGLVPGGWEEVRSHNRALALAGRALLADELGLGPAAPPEMIGSLVSVPLGPGDPFALHAALVARGVEVPVFPFGGQRVLRFSAAIYNEISDLERLSQALQQELGRRIS